MNGTDKSARSKMNQLRVDYHKKICGRLLGQRGGSDGLSLADSHSKTSKALSVALAEQLPYPLCVELPSPQASGTVFAELTCDYLDAALKHLLHIRPGEWSFSTSQAGAGISSFDQYEHLQELRRVLEEHPELRAALGGDYLVTPDIIVARAPLPDADINTHERLVREDDDIAAATPLRSVNVPGERSILHASVSCKWTIRSDRGQNTRTEALNLIRNRKGKTPIIVAATAEPMPTRLASLAMGTGDLDCVYHAFLPELRAAAAAGDSDSQRDMLCTLVDGRRLRDISDLPFDLAT